MFALLCLIVLGGTVGGAHADGITNSGNDLRDGWYPNQPRLSPDAVAGGDFGQLWRADVTGQVYAQPLVVGTTVIVVTEQNQVYALDSETGRVKWSRSLGTPFPARSIGPRGCSDLLPDIGATATPVVDTTSRTIYLTHKTYAADSTPTRPKAAYYLDALDLDSGTPRANFPYQFGGTAQNAPRQTFQPTTEMQRPGLLLMNGVVYAGFGGHCDIAPYTGWVFGVDGQTAAVKARWAAGLDGDGAGIWQSGAGLMSDGPGRIFVSTGNGMAPDHAQPAPGAGNYGESIVRLDVQSNGSLRAMDFFAPSDAGLLDAYDADFASGGVTGLRDDVFGTSQFPHVSVAVGKAGYVYLLNRDDLGGFQQLAGGGEDVLERVGPFGGVWSRPGVWPGDGGWIAIPTASPATGDVPNANASTGKLYLFHYRVTAGMPSLDAPVASDDEFGFGSSAPIITSDGTTSGSATMWTVWSPDGGGTGAQLRAYDAVPVNGHLRLRKSFPIGQASKFGMPGVGAGRMYVGTRDGHVLAYGAPVVASVQAPSTTFPTTRVGATSTANVRLTFSGTVHVRSITATPSVFTARPAAGVVGGTFTDRQTTTVPVDFTPTDAAVVGGALTVVTDTNTYNFSLTATGQAPDPLLTTSPPVVSFGGGVVGQTDWASTITIGNAGGQPLVINAIDLPSAPFSVDNPPAVRTRIAPNTAINVVVHYRPTAVGDFGDELGLQTNGGDRTIGLTGSAGIGPKLSLSPASGWSFGTVTVGESAEATVTVANAGDAPMTMTKSKPPLSDGLEIVSGLDEGSSIPAGASREVVIRWTPAAPGALADTWTLNAADGSGVHDVPVSGTAVAPVVVDPPPPSDTTPPDTTTPPVVVDPPVVTPPPADTTPPPAITPPSVGTVNGGGTVVAPVRLKAGLRLTTARLSRDGRRLAVRGRVARSATGPVGVTLRAKVGRRVVTLVTAARLRSGASTYAFTLTLPKAMRKWTKLTLTVRFPGTSRVAAGVATMVVVHGR